MSNLMTSYLAIQEERTRLGAHAQRGWQVDQAAAACSQGSVVGRTRLWAGLLLVSVGQRLQGVSRDQRSRATSTLAHPRS
ncbi:MAG: hypothetical protein H0T93_06075 [Chloroflexia bacterium]|nr:hypothetical protein [Chloroflexia bacterium]